MYLVPHSRNSKPIVIVVLVQRDEGEFNYWADSDVEREVKIRLEDSSLMNDFDVSHVKYVRGKVAVQSTRSAQAVQSTPRSILAENEDGGEMAWV